MFRREMGSKRGSLPPKEGDLTCMINAKFSFQIRTSARALSISIYMYRPTL